LTPIRRLTKFRAANRDRTTNGRYEQKTTCSVATRIDADHTHNRKRSVKYRGHLSAARAYFFQLQAAFQTVQINVTGQQIDVGDALRGHIEDAIDASIVLSRESYRIRASINMHVGRGTYVRAHEEADDPYAAFDVALAHLAKRLRRHKRRLRGHHQDRETISTPTMPEYVIAAYSGDEDTSEDIQTDDNPVIIAENQTSVESLTVSEAVMRMDLADGNVGWIDTPDAMDDEA
jgi:ribosomal subunit interface protein